MRNIFGESICKFLGVTTTIVAFSVTASAHDTWVQTNSNLLRLGDAVHVDLMLGNHGNQHRDFKMAGKADIEKCTFYVLDPQGKKYDLKPVAQDTGYTPTEGFWTAKFVPTKPGLYEIAQTFDAVMNYAPVRDIKSAKTFFVATKSMDKVADNNPGFNRVLGHALELVPQTNPVTPMGPGQPLEVRLLFKGKPLANTVVSFIPRGAVLKDGFDERYEHKTDKDGLASFEPNEANYYLIAAHYEDKTAKGEGYQSIKYSATLTLFVPQICPCCGG